MRDYNPELSMQDDPRRNKGGAETIEMPERVENISWQTRAAPPTAAENALADALQSIFAEGIEELPGIVERLNALAVPGPSGLWTEESFRREIARLGA